MCSHDYALFYTQAVFGVATARPGHVYLRIGPLSRITQLDSVQPHAHACSDLPCKFTAVWSSTLSFCRPHVCSVELSLGQICAPCDPALT